MESWGGSFLLYVAGRRIHSVEQTTDAISPNSAPYLSSVRGVPSGSWQEGTPSHTFFLTHVNTIFPLLRQK